MYRYQEVEIEGMEIPADAARGGRSVRHGVVAVRAAATAHGDPGRGGERVARRETRRAGGLHPEVLDSPPAGALLFPYSPLAAAAAEAGS